MLCGQFGFQPRNDLVSIARRIMAQLLRDDGKIAGRDALQRRQ